jgi:tyrosine-protein phosphatase SIW14
MHSRPFLALIMTPFLISCSEIHSRSSPIKNFRVIIPGEVYSGARPDADGLRWLESLGVKTVLNLDRGMWLETSVEVERDWKAARQLDMRFVHLPFHPTLPPTIRELHWAVEILLDPGTHPVFVHADRGSDRTGIVIAAYRVKVQGWSPDPAYREMLEHGFREIGHLRWKDRLFAYAEVARIGATAQGTDP